LSFDPSLTAAISNASAQTGVPESFLTSVALQESGGNQSAIGAAGEIGAFQLLPSTAASLGVDPYDVNDNALGGATYLSQLLNQFGGNYSMALAAYNAGPGTVSNAISEYGSNWMAGIPSSTQDYVSNILGTAAPSSTTVGGTISSLFGNGSGETVAIVGGAILALFLLWQLL
jgi:soluble lytic murein transglycosylase-like protein